MSFAQPSPRYNTLNRTNKDPEQQGNRRSNLLLFIPLSILVALAIFYAWSLTQGIVDPVPATSNLIVPGSKGIGNPPGAIQIGYNLPRNTVVTANLEGPISATILSTEQAAGSHVLRFNGVITSSK